MNTKRDQISAEIGARLRAARHAKKLSLAALAALTEPPVLKSRISNYEQGLRRMSLEVADALARALGNISSAQLLGLDGSSHWTEEELRLLAAFRSTDPRGRAAIMALAQSESDAAQSGSLAA